MSFGELLQKTRLEKGLTQLELAKRANVPVGSLRNLEGGHRLPGLVMVAHLARAMEVTIDELADCDEVNNKPAKKGKGKAK